MTVKVFFEFLVCLVYNVLKSALQIIRSTMKTNNQISMNNGWCDVFSFFLHLFVYGLNNYDSLFYHNTTLVIIYIPQQYE